MTINTNYLVGYFVSDGNFTVSLPTSKKTIDVTFKITSKNVEMLNLLNHFMNNTIGVNATLDVSKPKGKEAPRGIGLRIQGVFNVLKVLNFIERPASIVQSDGKSLFLIGTKYRTFLIVKYLIENKDSLKFNPKVQIDLIKSIHKVSRFDEDLVLVGSHTTTREMLETRYNLEKGSSKNAAEHILAEFDKEYADQIEFLTNKMQKKTLLIDPDFIVGLTDGDGSFAFPIYEKRRELVLDVNLTSDINSVILNNVWSYGLLGEIAKAEKVKDKNAYQTHIRTIEPLKKALSFFSDHPPIAADRQERFQLMCKIFETKRNGTYKYDQAVKLVRDLRFNTEMKES